MENSSYFKGALTFNEQALLQERGGGGQGVGGCIRGGDSPRGADREQRRMRGGVFAHDATAVDLHLQ